MTKFEKFQGLVTIVLSIATTVIAWKTFDLNEQANVGNEKIQEISTRLDEERLGFDIVRDIYDRTSKYLESEQNERQGQALVALITSIPESSTRSQLLSVISANSTSVIVAAEASERYTAIVPLPQSTNNSAFIGELKLELSDNNTAILKQDFGFKDSTGLIWTAPAGSITDGASIPASLQVLVGSNFDKQLIKATVIHDHYTNTRERSYESTHKMLFEALIASGVSEMKAKIFYSAVQSFGPRWVESQLN